MGASCNCINNNKEDENEYKIIGEGIYSFKKIVIYIIFNMF